MVWCDGYERECGPQKKVVHGHGHGQRKCGRECRCRHTRWAKQTYAGISATKSDLCARELCRQTCVSSNPRAESVTTIELWLNGNISLMVLNRACSNCACSKPPHATKSHFSASWFVIAEMQICQEWCKIFYDLHYTSFLNTST